MAMNKNKQSGMSLPLLAFILVMSAFLLLCFFRLGPAYLDNWYIASALKSLAKDNPNLAQMSAGEIRQELSKFYMINNIRGDAARALDIERRQERTILTIAYEVRVPIFANIDAMVSFNNVLDSSQPEKCCKPLDDKKR